MLAEMAFCMAHIVAYRTTRIIALCIADIQADRKVRQPIHDTCSICQKINCIEVKAIILSVENVHHVQWCMH
jgi:hypothetical protein